jgi:hypothetical protein
VYGIPLSFRVSQKNIFLLSSKTGRVITHNNFSCFHLNMQTAGVKQPAGMSMHSAVCTFLSMSHSFNIITLPLRQTTARRMVPCIISFHTGPNLITHTSHCIWKHQRCLK